MTTSDEAVSDDSQLYAAVAWCGRIRDPLYAPEAIRAVVCKDGAAGEIRTVLERARKSAMGELTWVHVDSWSRPINLDGVDRRTFAYVVEMLIDAAGKRPTWDTRKLEFSQVHPLADGAPGVPDPLA